MTDKETAATIRRWVTDDKAGKRSIWSWPTDPCGYDQHIRFVQHRNENWPGMAGVRSDREHAAWWEFCEAYATKLERGGS